MRITDITDDCFGCLNVMNIILFYILFVLCGKLFVNFIEGIRIFNWSFFEIIIVNVVFIMPFTN